jgi:hypothetical protein
MCQVDRKQQFYVYRPIIAEKAAVYEDRGEGWPELCYKAVQADLKNRAAIL